MKIEDKKDCPPDNKVAEKLAQINQLSVKKRVDILKSIASFMAGLEIGQNFYEKGAITQ